jgi:hypothetical protein
MVATATQIPVINGQAIAKNCQAFQILIYQYSRREEAIQSHIPAYGTQAAFSIRSQFKRIAAIMAQYLSVPVYG